MNSRCMYFEGHGQDGEGEEKRAIENDSQVFKVKN